MNSIPKRTEPKEPTAPPERIQRVKDFESDKQREAARRAIDATRSLTPEESRQRELDRATKRLERLDIATARGVIASQPLHTRQVYLIAEELGPNRERVLRGFNVSPSYRERYMPRSTNESVAETALPGVNLLQAAGERA